MQEPLLLHIETSGEKCSVALSMGSAVIASRESTDTYDHSATLAPYIQDVLSEGGCTAAQLQGISLSAGPGSYTGLRVGAATAKAMCYALGCPLIAVDTLESIALASIGKSPYDALYYPVLDARRKEAYVAAFDANGARMLANMAIEIFPDSFTKLTDAGEMIVVCGPAAAKCAALATDSDVYVESLSTSALHLVLPAWRAWRDGKFADLLTFTPKYVKQPNITKSARPRF